MSASDAASAPDEALIVETMKLYGISRAEAEVSAERRKVYGDPWVNHLGIAMGWAGLLQPWVLRMARMDPLPPHVVAGMMALVKLNRTRQKFHGDNFIDANVYMAFQQVFQRKWEEDGGEKPIVIGPAPTPEAKLSLAWSIKKESVAPHHPGDPMGQCEYVASSHEAQAREKIPVQQFQVVWARFSASPVSFCHDGRKYRLVEDQ